MLEQQIHCLDMDDVDYESRHCFAESEGKIVAYLRYYYTDKDAVKIGRVLTRNRGVGLGAQLMDFAIADIRENMSCKKIYIEAQKQALGFYEKMGFTPISGEFLEEGIVHIAVQMEL